MFSCPRRPSTAVRVLCTRLRAGLDSGMSTAEYAVGTVAACGFAALLWTVLHSAAITHALSGLISQALGTL